MVEKGGVKKKKKKGKKKSQSLGSGYGEISHVSQQDRTRQTALCHWALLQQQAAPQKPWTGTINRFALDSPPDTSAANRKRSKLCNASSDSPDPGLVRFGTTISTKPRVRKIGAENWALRCKLGQSPRLLKTATDQSVI